MSNKKRSYVIAETVTQNGLSYRTLPSLNGSNLWGFNLGPGMKENAQHQITIDAGDAFSFDANGKLIINSNNLSIIDSSTGKIYKNLIPEDIVANSNVEMLKDDDERQSITPTEGSLYFVKSTKIMWYYNDNTWFFVSGVPSGAATQSISVSVSASNEISANLKISNQNRANLISVLQDGFYFNVNSLGLSNFAEKNKIARYGETDFGLSRNDFNNTYKLMLDNIQSDITQVIPYASASIPGLVKIGTGLSISKDGVLSVGGTDITNSVYSVNGQTGDVVITKDSLGVGNVDNTSDKNKPVSDATWTELNKKIVALNYVENTRTIQVKKGEYTENDGNGSYSNTFTDAITISGFLTGIEKVEATEQTKGYYKFKKDGVDLQTTIPIPDNIASGLFDDKTNNLVFTTDSGATISVYLPVLTNTYTVGSTSTVELLKSNDNNITANVKVSPDSGNSLTIKQNGLYINAVSRTDLEAYVTYLEYNSTKHSHSNKDVIDRFGESENNELTYNGNVFATPKVFSEQLDLEQGTSHTVMDAINHVLTVTHNLETENIISVHLIENGKVYNIAPLITSANVLQIKIPPFLRESNLTLKITGA